MKLSFVFLIFAVFLACAHGHVLIKRDTNDARCDALAGTVRTNELSCMALFYRYTYVKDSNSCEEFVYGGCGGTANNFYTKEECERVCKQ